MSHTSSTAFDESKVLEKLKHHLPAQFPLKDFVHHNTLHGFQDIPFEQALHQASKIFGYKTSLSIQEYRDLFKNHLIREDVLEHTIIKRKGQKQADKWIHNLFQKKYDESIQSRVGNIRFWWKNSYQVDFDYEINGLLFKLLGGYLDQGIALWHFPVEEGFLASVRKLQSGSVANFVRSKLGKELLLNKDIGITELLKLLVGNETLFENYLFDQQFSHPGWSGMVSILEDNPESLMDKRPISLSDLIKFELILEIDTLETHWPKKWKPLGQIIDHKPKPIFDPITKTTESEAIAIWQEAFEWSYFDSVIAGIQKMKGKNHRKENKTFQALFCIDDREGSIRRHIESIDAHCETYGTPGHFGINIYYQPKNSSFYTKCCPGPVNPKHLIREIGKTDQLSHEIHFSDYLLHPILGTILAMFTGFWSGLMTFFNIFKPSFSVNATSSFSHMGKESVLSIQYDNQSTENNLQIGFTLDEMTSCVEGVLKSIGLVEDFGSIVYIIGHGASSINNTYYAGYDCGACSGRPGSVNARSFSHMANRKEVRERLKQKGIIIPEETQFFGGLHDTTRDEFEFYDIDQLSIPNTYLHHQNKKTFDKALSINAKERSRRFLLTDSQRQMDKVHQSVKNRSISLFETRPELNHAGNCLCIVGRHSLHEGLFLDRRAFSNSYDYSIDPKGDLLLNILNAATPVCGGINLEYYFSRVDNHKLGASSKLPHNAVGLIGVSNGIEGDLRTGLPSQMIEMHDPLRLLMIVEHFPEVVMETIKRNPATYQWYKNEWVLLMVIHPETYQAYRFENEEFTPYQPLKKLLDTIEDVESLIQTAEDKNLPVYLIDNKI